MTACLNLHTKYLRKLINYEKIMSTMPSLVKLLYEFLLTCNLIKCSIVQVSFPSTDCIHTTC